PVFAYFACGTAIDWESVLSDAAIPLVLTEGEFKALCACVHGIPTVALGGVDSFLNDGVFLPELEAIMWQGRHVVVCYDSDITDKPGVQAAERRLVAELKKRGAIVHTARLPSAADGSKQGLDDLIARNGVEHARDILLAAPAATETGTV